MRSAARRAWPRPTTRRPLLTTATARQRRRRQDAANNALLLQRMHGAADRRARFVSTLVALRQRDDPEPLIAAGRWEGEIAARAARHGRLRLRPGGVHPRARLQRRRTGRAESRTRISHRALAARQMLRADARGLAPWLRQHARRRSSTTCRPGTLQLRGAAAAVAVRAPAVVPGASARTAISIRTRCQAPPALPEARYLRRPAQPISKRRCRWSGAGRSPACSSVAARRACSRPTASTACSPTSAACCRWSRTARSRSRPTPAPSSASAFAPSRRPACTACRSACRASTTRCWRASAACTTRAQARAAAQEAREAFDTFNLDLMYALPGQTLAAAAARPGHRAGVRAAAPVGLPPDDRAQHALRARTRRRCPTTTWPATCSTPSSIAARRAGLAALRGVGLRAAGPPLPAQPQLLAVRRLPRHRRRRARQAELSAPRGAPAALARAGRLHGPMRCRARR